MISKTSEGEGAALSPDSPAAGVVAAFVEAVEAVGQVGSEPQQDLVGPASGQRGV